MANNIYLFNPQNDLALANGSPTFTAPQSSLDLAKSGACLPMWYGDEGDMFLGAVNRQWFEKISDAFGLKVFPTMEYIEGYFPEPWGWSAATRRYLANMGFPESSLPSCDKVDLWRDLSSRCEGVTLISKLLREMPELILNKYDKYKPYIFNNKADALKRVQEIAPTIIKLPWSNAGRGQQISDRTTDKELEIRIEGMIKHQRAVEVSPFLDKKLDFAMLWEDGVFIGYSLFETDTHGGWLCNKLIKDNEIENIIEEKLERVLDFEKLRNKLSELLRSECVNFDYHGPIGVDFIVGSRDLDRILLPVEINWRRTMGHVSNRLVKNFLSEDSTGRFSVLPSSRTDEPFYEVNSCLIKAGKLAHGKLDIVPKGGKFRFIFEAQENTRR